MLEIKQFDDWLANQEEAAEPTTNLKNYTDYVRSSYYSAGQLNQETEQEIAAGVADRLNSDGLFTDDMSEEDKNNLYSSVIGATRNADTDARFVLDYLRTNSEGPANVLANEAKVSNLANYLTLQEKSPSEAEGFKPYVDEILADKSLIKRARMSAVDRGEYSIAALDEEDGTRTLYAGPNARPESIAGEVKSLIATGALSSADLYRVNDFVKPLNGGLTNGAEDSRYETFARTISDLAKKDKDLNQLIEKNASDKIEQKTAELRTTGESIWGGVKTVISYPFIKGGDLLLDLFDGEQKQPKYAPDTKLSDAVAGNSAINQRFSAAEIEKFSEALTDRVAGAPYRADRPETGITTDSMGNVILAPSLLANVEQFNQAVSSSSLNKDQQKQASVQRKLLLESAAPDLIRMILEEEPEAVSSYAKAKADGLSPSEFVEQYVGNNKNYDAFGTRLEQFGKSAWKTLAEIPLGIAALAGNEWAATTMGDMIKDQTRRQEFSRLYGDEYGLGFQILNTLPQVAADIGLTIGTAGAFAGAKALAKTGAASARAMIRNGAKMALSEIDDAAAASFRKAASAEGSQFLGKAITDVGRSFGSKFGELAPLAAVTFTRSAGSSFGSLYNQLPDDMSHEEKYKTALPAALAMGISTSVITVGLSGLGLGAVEDIGTNVVRNKILGGDTLTTRAALEAAERAVPVSKMNYRQAKQAYQNAANEGRILSDKAFNAAARAAVTSTYKNWLKTTIKGGLSESFEEALDQGVGMAIENAALDRDASLAEKVAQVFDAGLIGGALGAGIAGSTQFGRVRKSEQSLVFEGRASAFEDIAKRLRSNNSNSTADVLQRRIDEAREQARLSVERDIAAQKTQEEVKERTVVADPNERPLKGRPVFNEETGQWAPADEPFDPLLDDILGEEIEYSGFEGVLELDADGSSVVLRLNKPYTTEGGGSVEFINLGPRFQKASKFTAPLLTIGQETFGVPAGTPYISMGGKKKTKFAFPAKEKVTPESFEVFRDDEGNVRSLIVKGGLSLKDGSTTMNIPLTNSLQIKAIAEWYGIDITPKLPVSETADGQFEFGFANRKDLVKSKEEFGFVAPDEPEMTDEELKAETEDILGRSFAPVMEGEMELVTDKQNRTRRILEGFDTQISSKQKNLKKVTDTLAPLKDLSDKQLTGDQKLIKQQSIDLEKKIKKEITALRKAKKEFSEDAIELGSSATQEPLTATPQGPRVYRSWDESQKQLDRDFAESINGIRQSYVDTDVPVDVDRIENIIRIVPLRNKLGTSIALSDVSIEELDAVESMAEDIISFAEDTNNKATPKQRQLIIDDYRALVARVNIIQQYAVEREYEEVFGLAVSELKALQTEPEPEEEVETKASDNDTLHYLLSNTPEAFTTIDVKPFADKKVLGTLKKMGVEIGKQRQDSVETVTVTGYDQETREILYEKSGVTVRAPLSTVNFESPTLRTAIDAASTEVFDITQQAKKEMAAIKRRTARPVQDRARDFLIKVNDYVTKSKALDERLKEVDRMPAAKRSAVKQRIEGQLKELRKSATKYVNSVGSVLQSDFDFYKDLEEEQKQEIAAQIRRSLYGVGGFKQEVAPRARVKAFNPTPDIKVTRVVYAKEQFRNGTQEEDMLNELVEGGHIVNLPDTGKALAQAGLFITESGVSKFPAFSQSQVELVEQEGQEVADTNAYIKDKHELLSEKVLSKYPQLGELVTITGRSRTKGTIGDDTAMLDSIEVEINRMNSAIEKDALLGRKVPSEFIKKRDGLVQQLKEAKVRIKDERYYEIDGKKYEVVNSKTDRSIYFPVDKDGLFGVFTNNPKITRAQIAAGYRVVIPDKFDRDLFNPSQYTRDGRIIEGYYMPRNPEPSTVGSFGRVSNPRIDENGEQILDERSNFDSTRIELFVNNMVSTSEIQGNMGAYFATSLRELNKITRNLLASKRNSDSRFPWSETYIDNTVSDLTRGFAAELNEYRLAQNVVRRAFQSLEFQDTIKIGKELVTRYIDEEGNTIEFSDLPQEIRDESIVDKLKKTDLVKFVTEMIPDRDVNSIAADIKKIYKNIKGEDSNSVIIQYAKLLYANATVAGGRFYSLPDPNTYLNRPANLTVVGTSVFNTVANRNAKAERANPNTEYVPLDYVTRDGDGFFLEEIIGAAGADTIQALQDEMDRRRQESGADAGVYDMLLTGESYASALESSDLVFMNRSALLASELYRTIAEDKTGKLAQVFRDLAVQTGVIPQYQADNLSDAVLVQSLSGRLNTDYVLHANKGYARTVLSTLSGTDLGKQAAGILIALRWLPPTMSLPLRAPAERKSATPAATATTPPDEAIAAGKALRQAEATDSDTIDYARNYLEASQAALPYLLKLGSERRIALNTIEEARADIYDSFRLLRTLIGQTDPEDIGPVQTKTKRQIAEGIEIGRVGVTTESVAAFQDKNVSGIEAEIQKLQDTRKRTEDLINGIGSVRARILEITDGLVLRDEASKAIEVIPALLKQAKSNKERTALKAELAELQKTYEDIFYRGDETLADLDASIVTKQKQLEKAKAVRELSGPTLVNNLIENIEAAYAQINNNREFLSELSESARARIQSESQRIERLRKLPEWQQYVEIIAGSPTILRGRKDIDEKVRRKIDEIESDATKRKTFDDAVKARAKALDQALIKNGFNLPKAGLITPYVDPMDFVVSKPRFEPSEGQTTDPNVRGVGRPSGKVVATFSEQNLSAAERQQSTAKSFSEVVAPIVRSGERFRPALPPLPTKEVGGRIKVLSKPKEYDPNDKFFSLSQIDPSLRDEARVENLRVAGQLGLVSGDPNSVLGALRRITQTGTPRQQLIAELLLTAPDFIRDINFVMVEVDLGFAGLYDKTSNSVLVNLNEHNGRGLVDVLLHEYLHAPTAKVLLNPKTESQRKAVARIEAIRNFAIANAAKLGLDTDPVVRLGLSNNAEFLTYALTAPEFQNILAGLAPLDQRSILRRLVDAILNVFGLDPKKHEVAADAIQELLDFTKMSLAHAGTFSVDNKWRALVGTARSKNERAQAYSNLTAANLINDVISRYNEDGILTDEGGVNYIRVPELEGDTAIDVLGEIRRIAPEGINIEINNTMVGAMGANPTKPNTILVNENLVATMAAGLSAANARAVVRTAVDEELAHLASFAVFKTEDFAAIAAEIGPDRVNEILDMIYSSAVPDATERAARIAADREAGVTGDVDAAAEWVRMEITRLATGRTREADIAFFYTNPSLLERFLEGLRAFINKLKQQFKSEPTAGTAARISQASRSFRKLRNGGALPTPEPSAANEYGDSTAFINAINGDIAEGQEDRTYFMLPVSGTGNSKAAVSGFWKTVQDKMYNLPMELRKYLSLRDGTISQVEYTIQDFDRRFPKMRDEALARGASIEDIGMILGTTAPVVQGEARKEIQRKVREFKTNNATDPDLERKADDYEAKLTQPEADKFFAAFRKQQKAMEDKLKSAGFGDLVDYLVEFRGEINKYKAVINFDESNDVYLTRTFRFFGSEGWASFAKTGGVAMLDGKEVDFNKLRAAAAKHFEWEVNNEAKQTGQTFTAEQHDKKLVEYLDKYLENLELQAADAKELGAMNTIRKDVNRLLNKKDFDEPLRMLLGEVTDPFENAVRTVYNVGRFAANERFLRDFASQAIAIGVASRTRKPDMELLFPPTQSAQLGDLAGLYVRNDIAATIREELGMNGMKQQSKAMEQINMFGRFIAKFSGLSITAKTLGSVGFYPRNVLGGIALTTSQGIVNPVYLKEAFRLSIIANMSLNGRIKAESEESRNLMRRLVELQVLKDDTQGRIAMDMLNGFVNSTDQQLEELLNDIVEAQGSGNIEKIIKKFKLKGTWEATKQAGGSTVEFLASLNNVIDSAFKLNAYFHELSVLKEAYGDTESEAKLEVDAARKVKLTFPTHSDQLSLAKAFNKSPFSMVALPFVRWKTEVFRTMFNTVPLAVEEIKSGNPTMRSRGIKRLIGFVTTMTGGGAAYGAIFATLFSLLTDDEEDERDGVRKLTDEELDALRQGLPKWQRNHGIFAQMLQDGSVQVIDMSNILPHSQLTDLVGLASRGNLKGMADYITSEMIGTQIAASTVFELAQNRDDFDQPIWLDTDGAVGAFGKSLVHLAKGTVVPSAVDKVMKIGRYGEQNAKEMIVGELTGVRPIIHKVTDIEYRGMRNLKESADAVVSLLYPLSSGKALDPSKVEGVMEEHQSASNKNQQKLHDFLMGMQSIGSTEASLAATAQQMKFSKQRFGAALAGENIPWGPNEQWFRKMYDNKVRVGEQNPDEIASEINRVMSKKADGYNTNFLE